MSEDNHIHSIDRCAHDLEGPTVWWLCGFAPFSTSGSTARAVDDDCLHLSALIVAVGPIWRCESCGFTFRVVRDDNNVQRMVAAMSPGGAS